jgi:hypothetical protein
MLRGTAAAIVVATGLAASAVGATALRGRNASKRADSAAPTSSTGAGAAPVATVTTDSARANAQQAGAPNGPALPATPAPKTPAPKTPAPVVTPSAPFSPILAPGTSPLSDGVTAFRADSLVTVSFDVPLQRTRMPDKFERFVRTTLPAVYGAGIDSVLSKIAVGGLASQGNLVTELPSAGVRIPVNDAWELRLFPETRKGQDGPLVVRYRTLMCGTRDAGCGAR